MGILLLVAPRDRKMRPALCNHLVPRRNIVVLALKNGRAIPRVKVHR